MTTGKVILISLCMCLLTGTTVYWLQSRQENKIAVVDAVRLFDQYDMKKELEQNAKVKLELASKQVDSVKNLLNMATATKNEEAIAKLSYAYNYYKNTLEESYKQSNQDINTQVWKRLNATLEDYGKKRGLHLIIGANGMGSVLFNDDYYDHTNDAIKFANKKYEEGN